MTGLWRRYVARGAHCELCGLPRAWPWQDNHTSCLLFELERIRRSELERGDPYCNSTHGQVGWPPGSYVDGDAVVCGLCGERVVRPPRIPVGRDGRSEPARW